MSHIRSPHFLAGLMLATLTAGLWPVSGGAQVKELLWRVENPDPSEAVPPFDNNISPFPIIVAPPSAQGETNIVVPDPEILAAQSRAVQAAGILAEIREVLKASETSFRPDTTSVIAEAVSEGQQGRLVLIDNHWLGKGDTINVPIIAAQRIIDLLNELDNVDPSLADVVYDEIHDRMTTRGNVPLKIVSIDDNYVELTDEFGNRHTVAFIPSGW